MERSNIEPKKLGRESFVVWGLAEKNRWCNRLEEKGLKKLPRGPMA